MPAAALAPSSHGSDSCRGPCGTVPTSWSRASGTGSLAIGSRGRLRGRNSARDSSTGVPSEEKGSADRQRKDGGDGRQRRPRGGGVPRLGKHLGTDKPEDPGKAGAKEAKVPDRPAHDREERAKPEDRRQVGRDRDLDVVGHGQDSGERVEGEDQVRK